MKLYFDTKTGRPRAENVQPAFAQPKTQYFGQKAKPGELAKHLAKQEHFQPFGMSTLATPSLNRGRNLGPGEESGTMETDNGKFGFITQDSDGSKMFVMPAACIPWGQELPPIGTRVRYSIVADEKTGRPRAEYVQPLAGAGRNSFSQLKGGSVLLNTGTLSKDNGQFGFITQDADGTEMFVLPLGCVSFGKKLPPVGTRVCYEIVTDHKTGRPRAENVEPIEEFNPSGPNSGSYGKASTKGVGAQNRSQPYSNSTGSMNQTPNWTQSAHDDGFVTGTMSKINEGKFGFITLDSGEGTMFVMPQAFLKHWSGRLPQIGTRLGFRVVADEKTGRPRAEDVYPA